MQFCGREQKVAVPKQIQRWQKPEGEILKINTDGAFSLETRQGGWGFVVRDNMGDARGSGAGAVRHACSAVHMEAHAIWEAVHAAADWGMGRIMLETDSSTLARALQSTDYDLAPEGFLFRDIRSFIQLNFIDVTVVHVSRVCNKVAHLIAAYGASQIADRLLWPETVIDDVSVLVASESAEPI
jgi:hypothetical protein